MTISDATDGASPRIQLPGDCILCGRCAAVCPLFAATGREELTPRAKFLLCAQLARDDPALSRKAASALAGLCLSCGRCRAACPLGLPTPDAVAAVRAAHPGWPEFLWGQWITRAGLLWPMAIALRRLASGLGPVASLTAPLSGLDPAQAMTPWLTPTRFDTSLAGRRVAVFPGCVAAFARTVWLSAARRLLQGTHALLVATQGFACCGAPLGHAGLPAAQNTARRANIQAWRRAGRPTLAVFCASCHHGLTAYPDALFAPGEAESWRRCLTPLSLLLGDTDFRATADAPQDVLYHQPCHAPPGDPDAALLSRATGRTFPGGPSACCGFGGLMQITAPDLSATTAAACWQAHAPPPRAHVLTSCAGCATQLAATAPASVTTGHWLEAIFLKKKDIPDQTPKDTPSG